MGGSYTVTVSGQEAFVVGGSLHVDSTIGKRSQAYFTVRTDTHTHFAQSLPVSITDQNKALVFSGYITVPKEQKPGFQGSLLHQIAAADQHYLADKRVLAVSYTAKGYDYIVADILNTVLAKEGVTLGSIATGPLPSDTLYPSTTLYPNGPEVAIPQAVFAFATVSQAMDALVQTASAAGVPFYWQIDENKRFWFVPYTYVTNQTMIDGTQIDQVRRPTTVTRANPLYRNTQYIVGGYAQTVPQGESRVGDGSTTTWPMGFELSTTAPTITVDGVGQSVGIQGIDSGKAYYWQQGSPNISQDPSLAKLTNVNTLTVAYIGQYPATVVAQNTAQIAAQAALDGTSGIVEEVEKNDAITSLGNGVNQAGHLLTRYAQQGVQLVFTTLQTGFAQGQLVTVNLPMHGLYNAQMLIESVSASDQLDGLNIWYTVTAVQGPYDTTWVDFFSTLLAQQAPANVLHVGVSSGTTLLASFAVSVKVATVLKTRLVTAPVPSTTLYPSITLYPG